MNIKLLQASALAYESALYLPDIFEARMIALVISRRYELPVKTWQYDTTTGEEQQTVFNEIKEETDQGNFVGDLFNYNEEG